MDVEIIDEDENPMLHRTDVRFQLTHEEATPSRLSVRDSLAAKLNKDAGEVVVHELDTKYGMRKTVGYAKVYEDADAAEAVEQQHMLQRNKIAADGETAADAADEGEEDPAEPVDDEEPAKEAESDPEADAEEA
jgi:small subunit ribosomal protein S24e